LEFVFNECKTKRVLVSEMNNGPALIS
jgi:hypothetical protein